MNIRFEHPVTKEPLSIGPEGLEQNGKTVFPLREGSFRLADSANYTDNFGFQWNAFPETQIDKSTNLTTSQKRFFAETNWQGMNLSGKNILEVGSGAGRFSQIILDHTEANLFSVDYSNAVDANFKNNGQNQRLRLFQASIYEMPFAKEQFDKVICLGVLQHTPDVERSVKTLIEMTKPGGELIVDFYPITGWWTKLHAKYFLRPLLKRMSHEKLYRLLDQNMDALIRTYRLFSKLGVNKYVNRFLPICDIDRTIPLNLPYHLLREQCLLDTFDMFSPAFDQPQKIATVVNWFQKYGMQNVWGGFVSYDNAKAAVVRGTKL
jgi:2-polyprenyl-3-methyl-5-hydroxy-6-metoxy-1,4-benzoquinol methylase